MWEQHTADVHSRTERQIQMYTANSRFNNPCPTEAKLTLKRNTSLKQLGFHRPLEERLLQTIIKSKRLVPFPSIRSAVDFLKAK